MTAMVEITIDLVATNKVMRVVYYLLITLSLAFNVYCVGQCTALSVFGTSLSLRGPDGSMIRAVDGMFAERYQVFRSFAAGLGCLLMGMTVGAWLLMDPEAAVLADFVLIFCLHKLYSQGKRLHRRFNYTEDDSVNFDEILNIGTPTLAGVRGFAQRVVGGGAAAAAGEDIELGLGQG